MDWYIGHKSNTWTDVDPFNDFRISEGIDLRKEFHWILYGRDTYPPSSPKGHWVIFRSFDWSKKSQFYSERTHEGVGGPAYEYTDYLIRVRRKPVVTTKNEDNLPVGLISLNQYYYYFEYDVNPKINDQLFELLLQDHTYKPRVIPSMYGERFTLKDTTAFRLNNGNVQYWIAPVQSDGIRY